MNNIFQKIFNCIEKRKNNNQLLYLLKKGEYDDIRTFLDKTPTHLYNINTCDSQYNNAYLLACKIGNIDIMQLLENKNIDIHKVNCKGHNAILIASIYGHENVLKYLIDKCKLNNNKLDVDGNNSYMLASKHGRVEIMKFLEKNTDIDIYHYNNNGQNAFTIHRYLCNCPENVKAYENMRLSVIHLAKNGFPTHFSGKSIYLADIYYRLYYKLTPVYCTVSKYDNNSCNICKYKFYTNQTILRCPHGHMSHVKCFVSNSCYKMCDVYTGFNHYSQPDNTESCIECNEPYIMKQDNIRVIKII